MGMMERLAVATLLISNPELLLVDETFSNVDNHRDLIDAFKSPPAKARIDGIFPTQYPDDPTLAERHYRFEPRKSTRLF